MIVITNTLLILLSNNSSMEFKYFKQIFLTILLKCVSICFVFRKYVSNVFPEVSVETSFESPSDVRTVG